MWAGQLGLEYPLLSDFDRVIMDAYGVPARDMHLLSRVTSRAVFIVDADHVVRYAWGPPEGRGQPPVEEVLEAARTLPARSAPPTA